MTIGNWLNKSLAQLKTAGVDSPRSDAFAMLENTTGKEKAWILAHCEDRLLPDVVKKLNSMIKRRINREPLAYILGKAWFYGRTFEVTPDVLIPRPESEDFIDILKNIKPKSLADIGTGSGCLAVSAKLELPSCRVTATDISNNALMVAKQNADIYKVDVNFLNGSLLKPLQGFKYEVVLANLPYVPEGLITSPEIKTEPSLALFAGKDGIDVYKKFWSEIKNLNQKPIYILTESLLSQHLDLEKLAGLAGYKLKKTQGLVQLFSLSR